jgi:hypothetical protein
VFFFITGAILSEYYDYDLVSAATILSIFILQGTSMTKLITEITTKKSHHLFTFALIFQ